MMDEIAHRGKIATIDSRLTTVEIISASACGACHAAGLCGISEYTKKAVRIPTDLSAGYEVGQEVEVVLKQSMGNKAVWLCYAIPLLVLLIIVLPLSAVGVGESVTGLSAIGGVLLYYLFLFLFSKKFADEYVFTVRPLEKK
ncbi:MAG: SoxR reducing system RseC family protein [Bacteroidales bacterium]